MSSSKNRAGAPERKFSGPGKIASLPFAIRQHVEFLLNDGLPTQQIAEFITSDPKAKAILRRRFPDHPEVSANNISYYRTHPVRFLPVVSRNVRCGKVARLPAVVREELNQRLLDGESPRTILGWLNADSRALSALRENGYAAEDWSRRRIGGSIKALKSRIPAGGKEVLAVSAQNLSQWRRGGFVDWIEKHHPELILKPQRRLAGPLGRASQEPETSGKL
jgi:hypothetical protein